jgi:sortase A
MATLWRVGHDHNGRVASRGRRIQTWLGVGLLLAGLSLVGWYCWQTFGTTWQSQKRHAEVVRQLEEGWGEGTGTATTVDTEFGDALAIIRIPRFGDDYAVPLLDGTSDEVLAAGFGLIEGTAAPGEDGNVVIAGHRITHGEPLRDMPDLDPGDEVVVETADRIYTYELTTGGDDLEVPFTASWVLDPLPVNPDAGGPQPTPGAGILTLTTCSELFHTDERLVAFASLSGTTEK